jgi:hypothetical protein
VFLAFDHRPSDSPFVERVWRSWSERAGRLHSIAASNWEMVVSRVGGRTTLTVRGPETAATALDCPADGEWIGIRFRLGTFMPALPAGRLIDRQDVTLPGSRRQFLLDGDAWDYPGFENAEALVARLAERGLIARDRVVEAVADGDDAPTLSLRSTQRRFLRATGLTRSRYLRIERARCATRLLRRGVPILDAVHEAGYFDQAHLGNELKALTGLTPAAIARGDAQLSFLYNTPRDA